MRFFVGTVMIACGLSAPGAALAGSKGQAILLSMEKKFNSYKDISIKWTLKVKHPGMKSAKIKFRVITRPSGQRLIRLTYPGDVKGMQILVQNKDEMYIYLPAFRKVRRIAGHVRNQGFQGSGFNFDDMSICRWNAHYDAKLLKESRTHWMLDLKVKRGKTAPYRHLRMRIRKDINNPDVIQYINRRGKKTRTQRFKRYKCRSDKSHCLPRTIQMIEHTRGNLVSEMKVRGKLRYNRGLSDRHFTVRSLLRSAN